MQPIGHEGSFDPIERARLLERTHQAVLSGDKAPKDPRPVVFESWQRSLAANVDPNRWEPPVVYQGDRLQHARDSHPLAGCLPLLRRSLLEATDEATHVMILTDADGHILWREGHPRVRRDADRVLLAEGTQWSESAIGTNAMGTTLVTDAPVQIHSAEHLVRTYHRWTCAASPVHDPETGRLLGSIDLSGPLHTMHPALLALVSTAATLVETHLAQCAAAQNEKFRMRNAHHLAALRGEPGALLNRSGRVLAVEPTDLPLPERIEPESSQRQPVVAGGRQMVLEPLDEGYLLRARPSPSASSARSRPHLRFMGEQQPTVDLGGRELKLTLRHAEILTLLTLWPEGLTGDQLALHLHGEKGNPATVRVEMHRLRSQLGTLVAPTTPYRLSTEVDTDFRAVRRALHSGDIPAAVALHKTGLLPRSESPTVHDEREEILTTLRRTILDSGNPEHLWEFANSGPGREDLEAWERLVGDLPSSDFRHSSALAHLERLHRQEE